MPKLLCFLLFLWLCETARGFQKRCLQDSFRLSSACLYTASPHRPHSDDEGSSGQFPGLSRRDVIKWGPILAAGISAATALPGQAYADAEVVLKPAIPFSASRQYRSITLANGLRVLLVSDRRAIRASAAFSIGGAGQFSDPHDLPGLAHLMEHMVLSSFSYSRFRKSLDFEDWISDKEGASNAFTGYEQVCFHFSLPPIFVQEALERFSTLFIQSEVQKVCDNEELLKREVRRVASELDFSNEATQEFYLLKDMMNREHPFSRFAAGNVDSLEKTPKEAGIDVGKRLFEFYQEHYQPENAVLVVVGPTDPFTLERWVLPFSPTLARRKTTAVQRSFPEPFKGNSRSRQIILYRSKVDTPQRQNFESLNFYWPMDLNYSDSSRMQKPVVTATQVGFVISQILGRRGPGSLYALLSRRGWLAPGIQGVPKFSFPVDVSGFQIMKLNVKLTLEGVLNRAVVVSAIYDAIAKICEPTGPMSRFLITRQLLSQYATVAQLHGYVLAPRPPDAIELAVDGFMFGVGGPNGVDSGEWRRFPLPNDRSGLTALQKSVKETLISMSDPNNAIIITTSSDTTLNRSKEAGLLGESLPFVAPLKWQTLPLSGALYYRDDLLRITGRVEEWFTARLDEDQLLPPVSNNLIPPTIRPPRYLAQPIILREREDKNWRILQPNPTTLRLQIPRHSEPSCRCVFVLQLLSPRPARANTKQAAYAELWKISFENAIVDLGELGAPAGCAYDLSFNKYGMRLCFLGISQNIASYARRFCRRLVRHQRKLLEGPEEFPPSYINTAIAGAERAPDLTKARRRQVLRILQDTSRYEAATEGIAFFKSCRGGVCFSQGDLLPGETDALFFELKGIFQPALGSLTNTVTPFPSIDELVYKALWKPRSASSCTVPGVPLMSDACGRVPR